MPLLAHLRRGALLLLLATALLLPGTPAEGAPDPRLVWRTLETPHFLIHFPDGAYAQAVAAAERLEEAHRQLVPLLNHRPARRTEVVLTDQHEDPNGMATSFPFPQLHARLTPPGPDSSLGHYDDYLWLLLVHEYVHVLHLDHTEGLPALGNRIFGPLFSPNGYQPGWIVEGVATRHESQLSGKGRNRSARVDMLLRTQLIDEERGRGELWPLGRMNAGPTEWPGPGLLWIYGGRVWESILQESGEAATARMTTDYAGRVLPFAYNLSAEATTGVGMEEHYETWRRKETARHLERLAEVEARGRREGRRLTRLGRVVGSPRPMGDGSVLFQASNGEDFPGVYRWSPRTREALRLRRQSGLSDLAPAPHGETLLYLAREDHQTFQFTTDLFVAPLGEEGTALQPEGLRLTAGMRATHLAVSPAGDRVAWIAQRRGEMAVYLASLHLPPPAAAEGSAPVVRLGPPRRIFARPGTPLDRIVFCPEGDHLALALHPLGGSWDVGLLSLPPDAEGEARESAAPDAGPVGEDALQLLAASPEDEIHPAFSPDHRFLIYSADREGIFDLFALPLEAPLSVPRRLTRVRTGAFEPRYFPDGESLAYIGYTREGYDIYRLPLDAEALAALAPEEDAPPAAPGPPARPSRFVSRPRVHPVRPYRPLATLRPHYWIPSLGGDALGATLGVVTGGADVVGKHAWGASIWLGTTSLEPGYSLAYRHAGSVPSLEVSSHSYLGLAASTPRPAGRLYFQQRVSGLSLSLSLEDAHYDRFQGLGLNLDLRRLAVLEAVPGPWAGELPYLLPESIWLNQLSFSWTASTIHAFAESISAEEGVRLTVQAGLSSRLLGSASDSLDLTLYLFAFQPLPFARRHVLAFRGRASVTLGGGSGRSRYLLGGPGLQDPFQAALIGGSLPLTVLRGYPSGAFAGDALLATSSEYRFPIWEIDRGKGFLPLFLRRITGALFLDVGTADDLPGVFQGGTPGVGVGAELRLELTVGYLLPLQLRLGLARGLTGAGVTEPFAGLGGVF
ncbi:MAG: BamA/TamA family outer membrane protein [Deltaproteobacteria bacterium]|nr:BamA/TamA family outer membrane protein [Deltaproteobacteria bacterium]